MVFSVKEDIASPLVGEGKSRPKDEDSRLAEGEGYIIKHRKIKYPRIEFKTGRLIFVLPKGMHASDMINRHHYWISKKSELIKKYLKQSNHLKIIERSNDGFRKLIDNSIQTFSKELGIKINNVFYRHLHTKWASCSPRRNIMINMLMRFLPKNYIEYIVYHELIHLIEKHHNEIFWRAIERKYENHNKIETDLFSYWFLIMNKKVEFN